MLGSIVDCIIDRPYGSTHPKYDNLVYKLNYGYIEGIIAGDGEEQDVYVMGVEKPINHFTGKIIAIYHRDNDAEEKWIVANENEIYTEDEIFEAIYFQEKYNPGYLIMS